MGKNWRVPKDRGSNGGSGGGGSDMASCRGHGVVLATCDVVREREGSKELVNLLNQAIESIYPIEQQLSSSSSSSSSSTTKSIQQLLDEEIKLVQTKSNEHIQKVVSINTDIKGVILAKILISTICPIKLVEEIFERIIRDKKPISKNIVRLIPLKYVFFPKEEDFMENSYLAMISEFPRISLPNAKKELEKYKLMKLAMKEEIKRSIDRNEKSIVEESEENDIDNIKPKIKRVRVDNTDIDIDEHSNKKVHVDIDSSLISIDQPVLLNSTSVLYNPFTCQVLFKARNHNVLTKSIVMEKLSLCIPSFGRLSYINPQMHILVEAIKNLGGLSIIRTYDKYLEFNLRKFQTVYTESPHNDQLSRIMKSETLIDETESQKESEVSNSEEVK